MNEKKIEIGVRVEQLELKIKHLNTRILMNTIVTIFIGLIVFFLIK
jgi:hypothetical protein